MLKIVKTYPKKSPILSPIFQRYFSDCNVCALDIETLGFNSARDNIILAGILIFHKQEVELVQLFAESLTDECELLSELLSMIEKFHIILNYNGNSFDFPFIFRRCRNLHLDVDAHMPSYKSFDLYRLVRKSYLSKVMPDLKLKTIEKLVGIERTDTISGKDSVLLYKEYLSSHAPALKNTILLHNAEDLLCFPSLIKILDKIDVHQSLIDYGFPIISKSFVFYVRKVQIKKNMIKVSGVTDKTSMSCAFYELTYSLIINKDSDTFSLDIPLDFCEFTQLPTPAECNHLIIHILKLI